MFWLKKKTNVFLNLLEEVINLDLKVGDEIIIDYASFSENYHATRKSNLNGEILSIKPLLNEQMGNGGYIEIEALVEFGRVKKVVKVNSNLCEKKKKDEK